MTIRVLSKWVNQDPTPFPKTDAERHDAFATYAGNVAHANLPWLMPLLDAAGATLYVGPSMFFYQLASKPGDWTEVPEMSRLIPMVPWVEREETSQ